MKKNSFFPIKLTFELILLSFIEAEKNKTAQNYPQVNYQNISNHVESSTTKIDITGKSYLLLPKKISIQFRELSYSMRLATKKMTMETLCCKCLRYSKNFLIPGLESRLKQTFYAFHFLIFFSKRFSKVKYNLG